MISFKDEDAKKVETTQQTVWVKLQRNGFNLQDAIISQTGWRVNRTWLPVKLTPHNGLITFKVGLRILQNCATLPA